MTLKLPNWQQEGYSHVWHPYSQMQTAPLPLSVVGTKGCRITLADERELIDGISSWWSACHGYNHPHIIEKVTAQLHTLPHVMFAGLAHEQAYTLATRLSRIAPVGLTRVFFSDSGSTAVEVALKMAMQYWRAKGQNNKSKAICFRHGYHGDTMGAMSVSDPEKSMHKAFWSIVPKQFVFALPQDEYAFAEFDEMLNGIKNNVAALIIEPLVQGAGGMLFHSADILAEIYRICKKHDILFIADEIATGFGRTGSLFACNEAGITPDIMCLGKALTGGTMTLAATLATNNIFNAFSSDDPDRAFMHGPTYMANALACAAANASLDLFETEPRLKQVEHIEHSLTQTLRLCASLPYVKDVRVKGAIGVVQLEETHINLAWLRQRFIEEGVWLRPFKDVIYLMPPFTISEHELATLANAVVKVIKEHAAHA